MQSPSSSRRPNRRGGDWLDHWTYATHNTYQVLWYCPPGGDIRVDKCGNRPALQEYCKKQRKPYPEKFFTFNARDVRPSWTRVADADEEQENSSGDCSVGAGGGGSESACSLSPVVGKVRMCLAESGPIHMKQPVMRLLCSSMLSL